MRRWGKPHLFVVNGTWFCSDAHYHRRQFIFRGGYSQLDAYKQWKAAKEVLIMASQRDLKDMPPSSPMATVVHIGTRLDQSGQSLSDLQVME